VTADVADRWGVLAAPAASWLPVPRSRVGRRRLVRRVTADPVGDVVLCDDRPGSRFRCRSLARRAGLRVEREFIVLPTMARPWYVVEDAPESLAWFASTVLTVPPGARLQRAAALAVTALGLLVPRLGWLAPARIVVGSRWP